MLTHVEFRSDRFPPEPGEEQLINPDLWGKRLADFLRAGLLQHGFETREPIAEDWGYCLPVVNPSFRLWIGCGHYQEYPDGYLCFIVAPRPSVLRFFFRAGVQERVSALQRAMDAVLSPADGIREKRWSTHHNFNNPKLQAGNRQPLRPA